MPKMNGRELARRLGIMDWRFSKSPTPSNASSKDSRNFRLATSKASQAKN
jgi:hypothetical protein